MLILILILAAGISFLVSLWCIQNAHRMGLMDVPNQRSSHNQPKPKGGGIGIASGMTLALAFGMFFNIVEFRPPYSILFLGSLLMAVLGFFSDRLHISPLIRMIFQALIAGGTGAFMGLSDTVEVGGWVIALGFGKIIFAVIWMTAITNFYNFMDGIDGLAGMQGILMAAGIAVFGIILAEPTLVSSGWILAGAIAGFLLLNKPPARIFMGDSGSYFLGFFIAGIALTDQRLFVPVAMMLGVFIFDTVVTLIRRVLNRERWYQAHRSHFYQRAVKLGYSHAQVTLTLSFVILFLMASAVFYLNGFGWMKKAIIIFTCLELGLLAFWVNLKEQEKGCYEH
ncbi:MAG: glycosyltransferase family 4 protein [Candidatus Omnitrophota bacterium]